jgi:hypothetical protein
MKPKCMGGITTFLFLILLSISVCADWVTYQGGINADDIITGFHGGYSDLPRDTWTETSEYFTRNMPTSPSWNSNIITGDFGSGYMIVYADSTALYAYRYNETMGDIQLVDTWGVGGTGVGISSLLLEDGTREIVMMRDNSVCYTFNITDDVIVLKRSISTLSSGFTGATIGGVVCDDNTRSCVFLLKSDGFTKGIGLFLNETTSINLTDIGLSTFGTRIIYTTPTLSNMEGDGSIVVSLVGRVSSTDNTAQIIHLKYNIGGTNMSLLKTISIPNSNIASLMITNPITIKTLLYGYTTIVCTRKDNVFIDDAMVCYSYDKHGNQIWESDYIDGCNDGVFGDITILTYFQPSIQASIYVLAGCVNHKVDEKKAYFKYIDAYTGATVQDFSINLDYKLDTSNAAIRFPNIVSGLYKDSAPSIEFMVDRYMGGTTGAIHKFDIGIDGGVKVIPTNLVQASDTNQTSFIFTNGTRTVFLWREKKNSAPIFTYREVCPINPVCIDVPVKLTYTGKDVDKDSMEYRYTCNYNPLNETFDINWTTFSGTETFYCPYNTVGNKNIKTELRDAYNNTITDTYGAYILNASFPTCNYDYTICTGTDLTPPDITLIGVSTDTDKLINDLKDVIGEDETIMSIFAFLVIMFCVIFFGGLAFSVSKSVIVAGVTSTVAGLFSMITLIGMGFLSMIYLFIIGLALVIILSFIVLRHIGGG